MKLMRKWKNIFDIFGVTPKYESMEDSFSKAEDIIKDFRDYVNNRISLIKLEIAEKISAIISDAISLIISIFFILLFLFFLSCGVALWIGKMLNDMYVGFLIVSCFYLITGFIIFKIRGRIIRIKIMNAVLKQFFNQGD